MSTGFGRKTTQINNLFIRGIWGNKGKPGYNEHMSTKELTQAQCAHITLQQEVYEAYYDTHRTNLTHLTEEEWNDIRFLKNFKAELIDFNMEHWSDKVMDDLASYYRAEQEI